MFDTTSGLAIHWSACYLVLLEGGVGGTQLVGLVCHMLDAPLVLACQRMASRKEALLDVPAFKHNMLLTSARTKVDDNM